MSNYTDNGVTEQGLKALSETFHEAQIEWRAQTVNGEAGWALMVPYITARAVQSRLDECCGVANWKQVYREVRSHTKDGEIVNMLCGISIRCDDDRWVTKWDGAQPTDIEGFKGSISGAFRRAAVSWGIGRFLYDLEPAFVNISTVKDNSKERMNFKRVWYYYDKPKLPKWCATEEPVKTSADEDLIFASKSVGYDAKTWDDMLEWMQEQESFKTGKDGELPAMVAGIKNKYTAKEICGNLIKYFVEEK